MARRLDVSSPAPMSTPATVAKGPSRVLRALPIFGFLAATGVQALSYSAAPSSGRVVDAETGVPIPGVIVLAQWVLMGGMEGGSPVGLLNSFETTTDQDGRYAIPGWGPRLVPFQLLFPAYLGSRAPELYFMKVGYAHANLLNSDFSLLDIEKESRSSYWDRKDVPLRKLPGGAPPRTREFNDLTAAEIPFGIRRPGCYWLQMPLTVRYLLEERRELRALGQTPDPSGLIDPERCGRPEWLKGMDQ